MKKIISSLKNILASSRWTSRAYSKATWRYHVFLDWFGSTLWTKKSVVITPFGFKLQSGLHPAYEQMRLGVFEPEQTELIRTLLPTIDVFVDVGANLGYYSCFALLAGKISICFEPQQQNLRCLFTNININEWKEGFEIFPVALSQKPGLLNLYGASGPSASFIQNWAGYSSSSHQLVPVLTLDIALSNRFLEQKILIKIDVEGAEFQVLKGSVDMLSRSNKPLWIMEICLDEFHPDGQNPDFSDIFQLFWSYGYTAYLVGKHLRKLEKSEILEWAKRGKSDTKSFNYLFADDRVLSNINGIDIV